jgi:hypothetical protein
VRPQATFCGQCYTDFRPAPAPAAPLAPAPTATYGVAASDPLTAPLLDVVLPPGVVPAQGTAPAPAPAAAMSAAMSAPMAPAARKTPTWPCTRCQAVNELSEMVCHVCAAPFLVTVAEETKVSLVLPVVGDLGKYGRGQRALIPPGVLTLTHIPRALDTLLLTHAPPAAPAPNQPVGTVDTNGSITPSTGGTTGTTGTTGG